MTSLAGCLAGVLALGAVVSGPVAVRAQAQGQPPPAVSVVVVKPQDVTLTTTLPGRVSASAEAEVRPQVNGIITGQAFHEGGEVTAGQILYSIDPTSYQATVNQAEASVAQAKAQYEAAQKDAERIEALSARNVASQQSLDQADAARNVGAAAVQVAQAQLAASKIDLDRTAIRARLTGQIGLSMVSVGALVTAGQTTPLAIIRSIDPVYVDVTQSAADLLRWRRGKALSDLGDTSRKVSLLLADGSLYDQVGELTAAEPHVDEQTGVVLLRMQFANPQKILLPGMYVQVEMPIDTVHGAFLVPQQAVSRDRRGRPTAMVVNGEGVVEMRELTVIQDAGSNWVVSDGLKDGDQVIVAGLQKARPGGKVAPEVVAADAGQKAPAPKAAN
ncbi:efflux RND transporter periplasmic adaptor subunit [bacterium]|nr:efflux RND transporter periplasmic adaptor subunit [bacterium]